MKKLNYIKPSISCFPYEDNIGFAAASDRTNATPDYKVNVLAPINKTDPNDDMDPNDYPW